LERRGFYPQPAGEDQFEIFSNEGQAVVQMKDGVEYVLRFGKVAGIDTGSDEKKTDTETKADTDKNADTGKNADASDEKPEKKDKGGLSRYIMVMARFNPAAEKRLLFLAHWDSRPVSDSPTSRDSSHAVMGANDGGSGVALLLGLADVLKRTPPTVGVDLLFVDGEDYGDFTKSPNDVLIGSRYYGAHQAPGPKPLYAVLFDLIADKDLQIYQEGNSLVGAPEVVELVWDTAKDLGYAGYFIASPRHTLIDDHLELQKAGIRAIDVVDFDYPAWHTQYDTIDKVSASSLQVVGDVAVELIRREGRD